MNGELVASAEQWQGGIGSRQISASPIEIGRGVVGGDASYFVGDIDEVRFWGKQIANEIILQCLLVFTIFFKT